MPDVIVSDVRTKIDQLSSEGARREDLMRYEDVYQRSEKAQRYTSGAARASVGALIGTAALNLAAPLWAPLTSVATATTMPVAVVAGAIAVVGIGAKLKVDGDLARVSTELDRKLEPAPWLSISSEETRVARYTFEAGSLQLTSRTSSQMVVEFDPSGAGPDQ